MKIALIGWGIETKSAYRYFGDSHQYLIVNEEPRNDFPTAPHITIQAHESTRTPGLTGNVEDLSYLNGIEKCDVIVLTPTAAKTLERVFPRSDKVWEKVTTIVQLFFENCPTKNIIGVTGTKGKGTTTTLIGLLLEAGGKTVHVGGNIGIAMLDILPEIHENDWVVLELSNFQLYHFPYSPYIAVHLMLIPEHIKEWHIEIEDYVEAKANIFRHQKPDDIAIYLESNEHSAANAAKSVARKIPYSKAPGAHEDDGWIVIDDQKIIKVSEVGLLGKHNIENICAAITAVWQIHQNNEAMAEVIRNFTGLEHRLQKVRTIDGVDYYDDSFGTTPDTAIVAMDSFTQPKVMIVGGHDKGSDYSGLVRRLTGDDIRAVIGIGITGKQLVNLLRITNSGSHLHCKDDYNDWTMDEIVTLAQSEAQEGDIVLLSTGSASFGIFADYKDRGNQFVESVKKL